MMKILDKKIALLGDIHIGVNKNSEEFFKITKEWISQFIEQLEERGIKTVIMLGDWYHYRDEISLMALSESTDILKLFPKTINIHMITGNHDCYFRDNSEIHSLGSFSEWENVTVYDKVQLLELSNGKTATMVPWGTELDDIAKADYIFGHFEIKNFKFNSFKICDRGMSSTQLLKKGPNVYTGHFHKYQNKTYKSGKITYVGSPFQHNFGDVGNENGFHILDVRSGECEFIRNKGFPMFHRFELSNLKNLDTSILENNFVKVIVDIDVKESSMEKVLAKFWSYKPRNVIIDGLSMKKDIDIDDENSIINTVDLQDSIKEYVDLLGDKIKNKPKTLTLLNKYYETKTK